MHCSADSFIKWFVCWSVGTVGLHVACLSVCDVCNGDWCLLAVIPNCWFNGYCDETFSCFAWVLGREIVSLWYSPGTVTDLRPRRGRQSEAKTWYFSVDTPKWMSSHATQAFISLHFSHIALAASPCPSCTVVLIAYFRSCQLMRCCIIIQSHSNVRIKLLVASGLIWACIFACSIHSRWLVLIVRQWRIAEGWQRLNIGVAWIHALHFSWVLYASVWIPGGWNLFTGKTLFYSPPPWIP